MLSPESQNLASPDEAGLFGGARQADLFGAPAPKVYVPEPRHVRNRLQDLLCQLKGAKAWPWEPVIVRLHRDRTVPYLCGLLPEEEAAQWRLEFEAELTRLEAA